MCPSPLYFSQASQHKDPTIILFEFGTRQRDPSGGTLFTLTHLCVFHPIATTHLTCVFASLTNDHHKHLGANL
jgi:hypothetical protein